MVQAAVGIRHHDEPQPACAQRRERGTNLGGCRLPQIGLLMIRVQLDERGSRGLAQRDGRLVEDEVEIGPAALLIVGRLNDVARIEPLLRARLRGRERRGRYVDAVAAQRVADALPVGPDEHAAGVEEHGLNRHRFSLHLSVWHS